MRQLRIFSFFLIFLFVFTSNLYPLEIKWKGLKDSDRIILDFKSPLKNLEVKRKDFQLISVLIPSQEWEKEKKTSKNVFNPELKIVSSIKLTPWGIDIYTKTPSFGFVYVKKGNNLYIDVFNDELGKYWKGKKDKKLESNKDKTKKLKTKLPKEENTKKGEKKKQNKSSKKREKPLKAEKKKIPAKGVEYKGSWLRAPIKHTTYKNPFYLFAVEPSIEKKNKKIEKKVPLNRKESEPKKSKKKEEKKKEPSPEVQLHQARAAVINGDYESAKLIYESLRAKKNIPPDTMIKVLYDLGDLYIRLYKTNLEDHYNEVVGILKEAFYYNPDYFRVPELLTKLMWVNMQMGNFEEAMGYFSYLKHYYPKSSKIGLGLFYLGDYFFKKGKYDKAVKYLYQVVDKYPTSKFVKQASIELAITYEKLGMENKAWKLVEYIQKRWFRFYLENPDFLRVAASIALKNKFYSKAKNLLWRYYNLYPNSKDTDVVLAHIGDCYLLLNQKDKARKIYERVVELFPDKEGALIAKMRLAEEGIYDEFSIKRMFSIFDRPFNLKPVEVYKEIVEKHPESPLAPLAQLKLISWYIWRGNFSQALKEVVNFKKRFPKNELLTEAENLGRNAFEKQILFFVKNTSYTQAVKVWNKYPEFQKEIEKLKPDVLFGIAFAKWKVRDISGAIELAKLTMSLYKNDKKILNNALNLLLNIYVESDQWNRIISLYKKFYNPKLDLPLKDQFRYAYALALEYRNRKDNFKIWKEVVNSDFLTDIQKGYVFYFLARHYLEKEGYENVYDYAQQALAIFIEKDKDHNLDKIKECFDMLITVTKKSGRLLEAIEWAERYKNYVSKSDLLEWTSYKYRLASLYRDAGYTEKWKKILKELSDNYPDSYYGKLATLDLESMNVRSKIKNLLK